MNVGFASIRLDLFTKCRKVATKRMKITGQANNYKLITCDEKKNLFSFYVHKDGLSLFFVYVYKLFYTFDFRANN